MKKSVSLVDLKSLNRNSVYNYIYKERETSKQQIVKGLDLGLSTVSQNIRLLEDAGLIERSGSFSSTGGRKPDMIRIVRDARISIGVGILKHSVHIVAVDLYGEVLHRKTLDLAYERAKGYYRKLGNSISDFVDSYNLTESSILGVSIATQGTISEDGMSVAYGKIMDNYDMTLADFSEHISYPCRLVHDSKSAAYLELWNNPDIRNAIVVLLNRNFGGSLIIDRHIVNGSHMHAGAFEHLCISRDGPLCYCGSRGCLEAYCSANALEETAGMSTKEFFAKLRQGSIVNDRIWDDYLDKLAFAIRNLGIIFDGSIIISGYLATYLNEADISKLHNLINTPPFPVNREDIIIGTYGQYAPAVGAALFYLDKFRKSV